MHTERRVRVFGQYIKDLVYGANDGIITTFAIITASIGANLPTTVILIFGFANLFADGFSMAASDFLGIRSEHALFRQEEHLENQEVHDSPDIERTEVEHVLQHYGFSDDETKELMTTISKNKRFWVDFMMRYELGFAIPKQGSEWLSASATFFAFVIAGSLPLLPFIFPVAQEYTLIASISATGIALFTVGAMRTFVTKRHWFLSGIEMLIVGSIATSVSYLVGYGISTIV
ncbi:MAG: VIT1/CCC1 transporter family protein [bacterium]|nr:VIT1/CCC1 transporter family protein [bacterium]